MKQDVFFKIIFIDQMKDQSRNLFYRYILGQIMIIKEFSFLFIYCVNIILYSKMDFAGVIKLRHLKWEDYPALSGWTLNATISAFIRGRQREIRQIERWKR